MTEATAATTEQPATDAGTAPAAGDTVAPAGTAPGTSAAPEAPAATSAPEAYEFKLNEASLLSKGVADAFGVAAKTLNLSQESAQQVLDAMEPALQQAQADRLAAASAEWSAAVNADPLLGKPEEQAIAKKAADAFCSPELKTVLNESGLGNHPEVVRLFHKLGKTISEDSLVPSHGSATGGAKDARAFFSASKMNP